MRSISIVNLSSVVPSAVLADAVRALQKQVKQHFEPRWGIGCTLAASTKAVATEAIYLLDDTSQAAALGYHTLTAADVPIGLVFAKLDLQYGRHWESTLSHELLEQLADPWVNIAIPAFWQGVAAALAYESCDPVENDEYEIDGVPVSNFVFPNWFQRYPQPAAATFDYLGRLSAPLTLSPGGYQAWTADLSNWHASFGQRASAEARVPHVWARRARRVMR